MVNFLFNLRLQWIVKIPEVILIGLYYPFLIMQM